MCLCCFCEFFFFLHDIALGTPSASALPSPSQHVISLHADPLHPVPSRRPFRKKPFVVVVAEWLLLCLVQHKKTQNDSSPPNRPKKRVYFLSASLPATCFFCTALGRPGAFLSAWTCRNYRACVEDQSSFFSVLVLFSLRRVFFCFVWMSGRSAVPRAALFPKHRFQKTRWPSPDVFSLSNQ